MFLKIIFKQFIKSKKLLQISVKVLDHKYKSETSLKIQESSSNPEKLFGNRKKIFFWARYLCQQSASAKVLPVILHCKMADEGEKRV